MKTLNIMIRIVIICVICTTTIMSISASENILTSNFTLPQYSSASGEGEYIHSLFYGYDSRVIKNVPPDYDTLMKVHRSKVIIFNEYVKQTTVPDNFIGPLAINQRYKNQTRTASGIIFYGEIPVDIPGYYRIYYDK